MVGCCRYDRYTPVGMCAPPSTVGMIKGIIASQSKLGKAYHSVSYQSGSMLDNPPSRKKKLKIRPSINLSIKQTTHLPLPVTGLKDGKMLVLSV